MPTKLKPFAAPAKTAPTQDALPSPDRNVRLRNGYAVAALVCYALVNLIGYTTLHHVTMSATDHALEIFGSIVLLAIVMIGFYIAFCCYGAKARGWSGWIGALIAGGGLLFFFGFAIALLFQNVNSGFSMANDPRVNDDRTPWLVGIAFVASALVLQALPKRTGTGGTPARQGA